MTSRDFLRIATNRDYLRIALNLSGCIIQVGVGYLPQVGVGRRIGATPYTVKAQPAGAAFAIWGIIFPLCIIYGIFQALPGQHTSPLLRRIGFFSAAAFYETIQWSLIAVLAGPADDDIRGYVLYEWILSLTLFCGIATPLNYILFTLYQGRDNLCNTTNDDDDDDNNSSNINSSNINSSNNITICSGLSYKEYLCVVIPLSIFAAWTTLASLVNIGGALLVSGVANFDVTNAGQGGTVAYLCCVGILIVNLIFIYRGLLPFASVAIWAYAWIARANFVSGYNQVGSTATVFAAMFPIVVLGSKWWWGRREALTKSHSVSKAAVSPTVFEARVKIDF